MRIGFTGSQGVGKTSLAEAMVASPDFEGYQFVPSAARDSLASGFKINKDADRLSQLITTTSRTVKEELAFREYDNTISDRMIVDSLAYTRYQMEKVWVSERSDEYYLGLAVNLAKLSAEKYSHVFYFPPYWAPSYDGVRSDDRDYQILISNFIEEYLYKCDIKHEIVPEMPVPDRLEWIKGRIH